MAKMHYGVKPDIFKYTFFLFCVSVFVTILNQTPNPKPQTLRWILPPLDCAGPPKISLFFFPHPPQSSFFLPLLGVLALNFGGVFENQGPQMWTFGLSGCRVRPWWLRGRRGFTRQPENSKRAHFRALQHHQNSTKGPRREGEKNENNGGRGKTKREIFGPPHPAGPPPFGPPPFGAHPSGHHPSGHHPSGPTFWASPFGLHPSATSQNWPKSKLAEVDMG